MRFRELRLGGAFLIEPARHADARGSFAQLWSRRAAAAAGVTVDWVQHSLAHNRAKGTLRGMHHQAAPYWEAKLVRCAAGAIYDVVLDLRPGSPTFGRWEGVELAANPLRLLYVPLGFAHGYQTLADDTAVDYLISEEFHPEAARGVRYDDPAFGIAWPLPVGVISDRDRMWPGWEGRRS